jgi:CheY-like chemotaxis protein
MDVNLPGMDGYQALRVLQSDSATAGIPVLATSANAMASDIQRGLAAGFVRYVTKPIHVTEFVQSIEALLKAPTTTVSSEVNP